ncbi:heat shock protein 23-like [Temnothorax curvispinosus]|uniref:Heat shock protein 23-like n=1 Tax=Temnothorax curvispinosus TaxID=300111 RepID=A0A6J1QZ16_9HYME|nr:heat shock protein 23-like [Temnothorax curvispinosus]
MGLFLLPLLYSQMHLVLAAPVSSLDRPENLTSRIDLIDNDNRRDIRDYPWWAYAAPRPYHMLMASYAGIDDNEFYIALHMHREQYKPEEITVKVENRSGHRWVVIEGKHETTIDDVVPRQFVRRFLLPDRAEVDLMKATFSSDGRVLDITLPLKPKDLSDETDDKVFKIE